MNCCCARAEFGGLPGLISLINCNCFEGARLIARAQLYMLMMLRIISFLTTVFWEEIEKLCFLGRCFVFWLIIDVQIYRNLRRNPKSAFEKFFFGHTFGARFFSLFVV